MNERILTHVFPAIWPGGGPAGYGYILKEALAIKEKWTPIQILAPIRPFYEHPTDKKPKNYADNLKLIVRRRWPKVYGCLVVMLGFMRLQKSLTFFTTEQLISMRYSKILVFHDWRLAYAYLSKVGRQIGQKIFLMPHTPVEWSKEYIESIKESFGDSTLWSLVYKWYLRLETQTWRMCDGIIVPSRYSLESYFQNYDHVLSNSRIIIEIPTGVKELEVSRSPQETREALGIPSGTILMGFFGRKHPHKGYDIFCQVASEALQRKKNFLFISAGTGPSASPNLPNLIDLGYVDKSRIGEIIAACDLVIVPNRVHYFDLVILESMSLGKVVVTTKVGGAKSINSPGVFLVESTEPSAILSFIERLISNPEILYYGRVNQTIFKRFYSISAFAQNHYKLAEELLNDG